MKYKRNAAFVLIRRLLIMASIFLSASSFAANKPNVVLMVVDNVGGIGGTNALFMATLP